MNQTYRLVWGLTQQAWVVAGELAKANKKSSLKTCSMALLLAGVAFGGQAVAGPALNTLPTGETVVSGRATFDRSVDKQLTINQSTNKLITNWNSFNVGSAAKVVFAQPNTNSIALNRISSGSATEVFGQVTANGRLVLVNPNGIAFGGRSQVSANALIASVLDIQDSDFNNSTLLFSRGNATGSIENRGKLTATGGSVSLLAPTVKNSGSIAVTRGDVNLLNADVVQLNAVNPPTINTYSTIESLIQQSGNISATQVSGVGGKILLTATVSQPASQILIAGNLLAEKTEVNGRSIVINGTLNVNGDNHILALPYGYTLVKGITVNLNGTNTGFISLAHTYTVIRDINQLQAINNTLSAYNNGYYVLANNIDASATVNWNNGMGFEPIGRNLATRAEYFRGVLEGLGHSVNNLTINRPNTNHVGLLGDAQYSKLQNIGLIGAQIKGYERVGGLAGSINVAEISNSYVTGNISGAISVGGLSGSSGSSKISNSYANVQVQGKNNVGGLVGDNGVASIQYSYSTGLVNGESNVGGLVGNSTFDSSINSSYTSARVVGNSTVGGLVGYNYGSSINTSYATGRVTGIFEVGGLVGNNFNVKGVEKTYRGLVQNSYWDIQASGQSSGIGKNTGTVTQVTGLGSLQFKNLASFAYWGTNIDAQGGTDSAWRIYDGQTAPLLRTFLKPVDVVIGNESKTYDGLAFKGGSYSLSDPSAILQGSLSYSGNAQGARNAGAYTISGSGLYSGQQGYDIRIVDGNLAIDQKSLTIKAVTDSKVYDGKLSSVGKPVVSGLVDGDYIVLLKQVYSDKNVGTDKTISVADSYLIRDKNNGNNYAVTLLDNTSGVITPKALTISTVANSKVYNGNVSAASKPLVTGLVAGDSVSGLFEQYETREIGTGKKLLIKPGYVLNDGDGGGNYIVTEQTSNDGVITAH